MLFQLVLVVALDRVTPLAAPMLLEVGKVPIQGMATDRLVAEEAMRLMQDAGLDESQKAKPRRGWRVPY